MSSSVRKTQYIAGAVRITYNIDDYDFNIFNKDISPKKITQNISQFVVGSCPISQSVIDAIDSPSAGQETIDFDSIVNSFSVSISGFSVFDYYNPNFP